MEDEKEDFYRNEQATIEERNQREQEESEESYD